VCIRGIRGKDRPTESSLIEEVVLIEDSWRSKFKYVM
jgi:hypothetical protein